jgi:PAS domain S-box-containing protein
MFYDEDPGNSSSINVLLVEDSASAAAMIRDSLQSIPGELVVKVATTIAEARTWLDYNTPDLAIVDLNLPDGKGTVLLPMERNQAHFPIIIMTDAGSEVEAVEAIKSGAIDYLVKSPEVIRDLPKVIGSALRQWGYVIRQRLTEDALLDSEERFRSIFVTAAAGMVVVSPFNNIMQVNPAFCRFCGYSEEELLSRRIDDLTHPDDRQRVAAMYDDLFAMQMSSLDCERRYIRKDGSVVWGHVSLSCILGPDRTPAYCIALVQDISLRKALEEKLLQANRELDAFVHTVSHDLRSPLTPIIGYLQFILEQHAEELSPAVIEMLGEVLRQGERMHAMLEDLLALATVGMVEPPASPVCGDELLAEVMHSFSADPRFCRMKIQADKLPDLKIPKTLYRQILDNLVGNAIRYAGDKLIEVRGERRGGTARLSVRDYGSGVPAEEKERIFELFYRGTTGKEVTGTGIGLATVRKIARLHHGSAWVEDAPGGGSLFIVELQDGYIPV